MDRRAIDTPAALAPPLLLLFAALALIGSHSSSALAKEQQEEPSQSTYSQAARNVLQIRIYENVCPPDAKTPVQKVAIGGTGFFVQRHDGESRALWLVTARHVVENRGEVVAVVQTAASKTGRAFLSIAGNSWRFHPGPNPDGLLPVDVAVARVTAPADVVSFRYCPGACGTDSDKQLESQLQEPPKVTERALFFGFPLGETAPDNLEPFARSGIVAHTAANPSLTIGGRKIADDTLFLVDAPAFIGNSGGPVMREPSLLSGSVRLFGLVTGFNASFRAYTLITSVTRIKEAIEHAVAQEAVLVDAWTSGPPPLECRE